MLMTDDLDMKALSGTLEEKTKASLDAGCNIVLQCNGKIEDMRVVVSTIRY